MLITMGSLLSQSEYRRSVTSCGSKASRGYVKRQLSTVYSSWSDVGSFLKCDKQCSIPTELKADVLSDFQELMLKHLKLLSNNISWSSVCIGTHKKCFQSETDNWIDSVNSSNLSWRSEKPNSVSLNKKSWINCLKQHWLAKPNDSIESPSLKPEDLSFSRKIKEIYKEKQISTNTYEQFTFYNNSSIIHTQVCKNNLDCLSFLTKMLFSQFLPENSLEIYNQTDFQNLRKFPFFGNMYISNKQILAKHDESSKIYLFNQEIDNSELKIHNSSSQNHNIEMDTSRDYSTVNILSMKMSDKDAMTKVPIEKYSINMKFNSGILPTEMKSNHSAYQNKFTKDKRMMDISNSAKPVYDKEKMASKADNTCSLNDIGETQSQSSRLLREKKKSRPSAKKRRRLKERNTVLVKSQATTSRLHPKVSNCKKNSLEISGSDKSNDKDTLNKSTKSSFSFMVDIKNCDRKSSCSSDRNDKSHLSLFISGAELDSSFSESDEDDTTVFEASFCEMFDSFGNGFSPFSIQMEVTNVSLSPSSNCDDFDDVDYVIQQTIQEANMKWDQYYGNVFPIDKEYKKVQFAPDDALTAVNFVDVHERKGPWEQYALDRHRFQNRIKEVGQQIQHCFTKKHRDYIYKKYFT